MKLMKLKINRALNTSLETTEKLILLMLHGK